MDLSAKAIEKAAERLNGTVSATPLRYSKRLSGEYGSQAYPKMQYMQAVRP